MRRVLLIAVVLVLVGGCTGGGGGPAEPTGLSLPPRPRDLRIDGVEPCSLLTEQQRAELGLDGRPTSKKSSSALFRGDETVCLYSGFAQRAVFVGVGTVATAGIDAISDGDLEATLSPVDVEGFPAVRAVPSQFTKFCSVFVDVGPGQLLDVQFSDGGRPPPIPQDRLCGDAEQVARAVLRNLLDRSHS